jgi:hypothetical protein
MRAEGVRLAVISEWLGYPRIAMTDAHSAAAVRVLPHAPAAATDRALGSDR